MNRAPPSPKQVRIATRLETLPPELIEPVLKDLPFHAILDLAFSASAGPRLLSAIESSPSWSAIFKGRMAGFGLVWKSINDLSWIWTRQPWMNIMRPRPSVNSAILLYSSGELRQAAQVARLGDYVLSRLGHLYLHLFKSFIGRRSEEAYNGIVRAELQALCLFLPTELVLSKDDLSATLQKHRDGHCSLSESCHDHLEHVVDESTSKSFADMLTKHVWTTKDAMRFLPHIMRAYEHLAQAWSTELDFMADLYERFPAHLKTSAAPQTPRPNKYHILKRLRRDARYVLTRPLVRPSGVRVHPWTCEKRRAYHRFRYPYPTLIPYDWCLRLFNLVLQHHSLATVSRRCPPDLIPHLHRAIEDLASIHRHGDTAGLRRTVNARPADASFETYSEMNSALPKPLAELDWLRSFITVTSWMKTEYADITTSIHQDQALTIRWKSQMDASDYKLFIEHEPAQVIARQLRRDSAVCEKGSPSQLPSLLALYMPPWPSLHAMRIAKCLVRSREMDVEILQLVYDSMLGKLRRYLQKVPMVDGPEDGQQLAHESLSKSQVNELTGEPSNQEVESEITQDSLVTTAKTLHRLFTQLSLQPDQITAADALTQVVGQIEKGGLNNADEPAPNDQSAATTRDSPWKQTLEKYINSLQSKGESRDCYICLLRIIKCHKDFQAMCVPCGDFNLAGSNLSLPAKLNLDEKVALVTGGRINLGFHVALRFLRCGARVIVSTRYPLDALSRYQSEHDSHVWSGRLRIIGADFRAARDAFDLVGQVRTIVEEWGGKLHILINNAAQTLTDSIEKEEETVRREKLLLDTSTENRVAPQTSYEPRVRAGNTASIEGLARQPLTAGNASASKMAQSLQSSPRPSGSSWIQSLTEIPYEDIISAHSVNTFVPLILVRELLPIMSGGQQRSGPQSTGGAAAAGYIVNVSSREGIFERWRDNEAKNGRHVHTNMSKAALNMITETEASTAWKARRVAMNTVDPGYMSAAPEFEDKFGGERPLTWEDGAGRVLWPIAMGELGKSGEEGCYTVWGRFLKHYGAVRVEPRFGRG